MSNVNLVLWAVPVIAFLMALERLTRRIHFNVSKRLVREAALRTKFAIAASAEAPGFTSLEREALGLPGSVPGTSGSVGAAKRGDEPLSRESLGQLCRKFQIREVSILPATRPNSGLREPNLQILVEFEPQTKVDYPLFFRLRQELFVMLDRRVELVCKNTAKLEGQQEAFAQAKVLYAA
jgi:predicted nucleotidyltransferase